MHVFFFCFFFCFGLLARHKIISFSKSRPWVYFYHIVTTAQIFNLDFLIEYLVVNIKKECTLAHLNQARLQAAVREMSPRCILLDLNFLRYVLPRIIAGAIISNIAHWELCPKLFVLLSYQINWTWAFYQCSKFGSLIDFQSFESSLISFAGSDSTST